MDRCIFHEDRPTVERGPFSDGNEFLCEECADDYLLEDGRWDPSTEICLQVRSRKLVASHIAIDPENSAEEEELEATEPDPTDGNPHPYRRNAVGIVIVLVLGLLLALAALALLGLVGLGVETAARVARWMGV